MSLFANPQYRWRETYSILFRAVDRPAAAALRKTFEDLRAGYRVTDVTTDAAGQVESATVIAPADFAGMDLSFVAGEDVREQICELLAERKQAASSKKEQAKLRQLTECDARFDVFHFEQIVADDPSEDDEYMDPGSLISLLKSLAHLCRGVGVDSTSGALL